MNKQIKDYLHLYLGCEVLMTSMNRNYKNGKIYTLSYQLLHDYCKQSGAEIFKPVLRPLSDMTEKEANDVEWYMWDGFPDACFGNRDEILKMFIHSTENYRPGFQPMVRATNWLRKHGFDIDGLIEEGLAIDATTINNQTITK